MPTKDKCLTEQERYARDIYICKQRLQGISIIEISDSLNLSRQCIYNVLKKFPKDTAETPCYAMPYESAVEACDLFLHGQSVPQIAETIGEPENDIYSVFYALTAKRVRTPTNTGKGYPAIIDWLKSHGGSTDILAGICQLQREQLWKMLSGRVFMPYDVAIKIKDYTGLTLNEIYDNVLEALNEED